LLRRGDSLIFSLCPCFISLALPNRKLGRVKADLDKKAVNNASHLKHHSRRPDDAVAIRNFCAIVAAKAREASALNACAGNDLLALASHAAPATAFATSSWPPGA
jgi:hypothetical protein